MEKTAMQECLTGNEGQKLYAGERVCTHDYDGKIVYGTLRYDNETANDLKWWIEYDDGVEAFVLDASDVFKVNGK